MAYLRRRAHLPRAGRGFVLAASETTGAAFSGNGLRARPSKIEGETWDAIAHADLALPQAAQ
jgi:hypothetical protein